MKDSDEILNYKTTRTGKTKPEIIQEHKEDCVFIVHGFHLDGLEDSDFNDVHRIHLERLDKIGQLISAFVLQHRIHYKEHNGRFWDDEPITLTLDENHLYTLMSSFISTKFLQKHMYDGLPIVYYEDLEKNPLKEVNKVFEALNLPKVNNLAIPPSMRFKHRTINEQTVTNYDEAKQWIFSIFSNSSVDDILKKVSDIVCPRYGVTLDDLSDSIIDESRKAIARYLNNHGIHDQ